MSWSALLLAGGRSRRLGRLKPLVDVGGRTVLARLLDSVAAIDDIVLSVRDEAVPLRSELERLGWRSTAGAAEELRAGPRCLRVVPDPEPDRGPVAGLAAGLTAARHEVTVVLAGDLPFVTPELVGRLLELLERAPGSAAVIPFVEDRDQPLAAAYRTRVCAAAARRALRAGSGPAGPSMANLLASLDVERADARSLGPVDEIRRAVRGIDTAADLEWAERSASRST